MKRINYFVAMAAALAIGFTSCSDDPDPAPAQDIAKEYTEADLTVTNAGEAVTNGKMKIDAVDNTNATITLTSIVNGQASFEVPATVVQATTGYAFEGKKDVDGMKVAVKGTVVDGKATADVTVEITAKEILGAWEFSSGYDAGGLIFNIKTKSGKLIYYANEEPEEWKASDFCGGVEMMAGSMLGAALVDFSFNFQSNGYVGIKGKSTFSPEGKQDVNMPKLARYYYNPTSKTLIFDAPLDGLMGKSTGMPSLSGTMQVPFHCTFKDGAIEAIVDQALLNQFIPLIPTGASLDGLLQMLDGVMPENMAMLLPWVKGNIKTIAVALSDKENFESLTLGGRLVPVKEDK